ncbi:cobalt-precorrin-6A reductase [Dactylosporangium sp. NPDC005555]|uniref:cobalt-precorrin-6A reductase n=1 Tax=Dactylosporangium sp. NPDC005555 TaxID=3154889 RepID=UPI0033AED095
MRTVLILGGTGEARQLAGVLTQAPHGRHRVISSLAGRVADPALPPGEVRVGGFGGPQGLAGYVRAEAVDVVVDATHPFAARISASASAAGAAAGVPLLVLRRPGWVAGPGDDWHRVPALDAAAAFIAASTHERVFLTTGRQGLGAFASLTDRWFLVRSVDPVEPPHPPRLESLLDRGPFTADREEALLTSFHIQILVTKDSGGTMTAAKLTAARRLALPVLMVDRPPVTPGVPVVADVTGALTHLRTLGIG